MKSAQKDYYEILKVDPGADAAEVKRAYRVARESFRPGSLAVHSLYTAEEAEAIAARIEEAFQILSQPETARRYDKYRRTGGPGQALPLEPGAFFDRVHDIDGPSPIESLARRVSARQTAGVEPPPLVAPRRGPVGPRALPSALPTGPDHRSLPELPAVPPRLEPLPPVEAPAAAELSPAPAVTVAEVELFFDDEEPVPAPPSSGLWPALEVPEGPAPAPHEQPLSAEALRPAEAGPLNPTMRVPPVKGPTPTAPEPPPAADDSAAQAVAVQAQARRQPRRWTRAGRQRAAGLNITPLSAEDLSALEAAHGGRGGAFLRAARGALGVSIEEVSQRTKVSRHALHEIEADDIDELPARVYVRGYLQSIARLLCLPVPATVDGYMRFNKERFEAAGRG